MRTLLLLLCLLYPGLAQAAVGSAAVDTWYAVAGCANNGDGLASTCAASDGASGAFNSFANVIYTVMVGVDDGDTLCISGKFRETLTHTASGTVSLPITYKLNCNGLTAGTITGADIEASWTGPDGDRNYTSGSSYTSPTWLLVDGVAARHGATAATLTAGQWYYNGTKVLYRGNPSGHTMEIAVRGVNINSTGVSNIIVTGGRMEATAIASALSAITFKNCSQILVTGVTFYAHRGGTDFRGSCINASSTHNTMSMVSDGVDANFSVVAPSNITYAYNRISSVYLNGTDNFVANVETTHSFHFDKECIANTSAGSTFTIKGNELSDCSDAISLLPATDVTGYAITSNYIHDVAFGGIVVVCSGNCNITQSSIAGNLIAGCGLSHDTSSGIAYNGGASAPGAKIDVVNNGVIGCSQNYVISFYSTGDFVNNLSIQPTRAASPYHVNFVNWTNVTSATINNNAYYSTATAWWRKSAVRTTLANWQADMTPNETAALNTDPLVLSLVSLYNLRTQATSPLRHAGRANTNCIDVRGRVCRVPPDIGAYQAGSGDPAGARAVRQ